MEKNPIISFLSSCNPDPSKAGSFLLILNALGMAFAAVSNTFAAATDKNTSKEDKKFLVPAGSVTGVANIVLYYGMTNKIIKKLGGQKLYKEKAIKKALERLKDGTYEVTRNKDNKIECLEIKGLAHKAIEKMQKEGTFDEKLKSFVNNEIKKAEKGNIFGFGKKSQEYVAALKSSLLKDNVPTDYAKNLFKDNVKAGMGVMGAFIGAVVGCAIITPIIRDVSAYIVQKQIEKNNPELKDKPYRPYFDPSHFKVQYNGKKQPLSLKNYMAFTNSGNLKV